MRTKLLVALSCLLAGVTPLAAQQTRPQRNDAASKDAARRHPALAAISTDMTTHCASITRLQNAALEAASRTQRLARAAHVNRPALQAQALTSHNDVQALLRELDASESSANEEQKAVIASVLVHDRQAEQHAAVMVSTAQKQGSTGSDIGTQAATVIQHLRAAQAAMRTDPNTGLATGQRRSLLCATAATGTGQMKPRTGTGRDVSTGQASGKRQY